MATENRALMLAVLAGIAAGAATGAALFYLPFVAIGDHAWGLMLPLFAPIIGLGAGIGVGMHVHGRIRRAGAN